MAALVEWHLSSPEETLRFGNRLGSELFPGAIVLLDGPMGVGKTTLAKGICAGLDVPETAVVSPTYTIANRYLGRLPVSHVDLFRLEQPEQLDDFDRDDLIPPDGVTLVEWPDLLQSWLAPDDPELQLQIEVSGAEIRKAKLTNDHPEFAQILNCLHEFQ